ncbi:hypothetical protein C7S14_1481 [Burkholderia cepacia]|nr:hypothetical protein C7S14_1481 [Burkholderia cepacia]
MSHPIFRRVSAGKRVPAHRRVTIDCRQRLEAGKTSTIRSP